VSIKAIEVRLTRRRDPELVYVLEVHVKADGTLSYALGPPSGLANESLGNLQGKAPYPRVAVEGWHHEVLDFLDSTLYRRVELREIFHDGSSYVTRWPIKQEVA